MIGSLNYSFISEQRAAGRLWKGWEGTAGGILTDLGGRLLLIQLVAASTAVLGSSVECVLGLEHIDCFSA